MNRVTEENASELVAGGWVGIGDGLVNEWIGDWMVE